MEIQKAIQELSEKIYAEKERLLLERIKERVLTNEPINVINEFQRRFPRIKIELYSHDQSEHYYWNDGTKEGLHLISFYQKESSLNINEPITFGFTYK